MATLLEKLIFYISKTQTEFVIFETQKIDEENFNTYIFYSPFKKLILKNPYEVKDFFKKIEEYLNKGFYLAGFFSYELGYFLDYKRDDDLSYLEYSFPLGFFYVFSKPVIFNHKENKIISNDNFDNLISKLNLDRKFYKDSYKIKNIRLNITEEEYISKINKIKEYIYNGDTYQINYTIKTKFKILGSKIGFYNSLKQLQKTSYSAFIKTPDFCIISFSPELFFRKNKDLIYVKPMKGTISRGKTLLEDEKQKNTLKNSIKDKAENIMIVDLLRNDLGKISPYGNVKVDKLFEIEKYETLFQMTSTIKSKLKRNISFYELFKALFPSGSVTGAPKIRSMQIIKELEKEERKVYTGAIGFITPEKDAVFNVAIRTVLVCNNGEAEMGIGSGIVADSQPKKEFEECKLKAHFIFKKATNFFLLETILYSPYIIEVERYDDFVLKINHTKFENGFFLLSFHLKRLEDSADYFGFRFSRDEILGLLKELKNNLKDRYYKIRLLLSKDGRVIIQKQEIPNFDFCSKKISLIKLSNIVLNQDDVFLYHKTTNRRIYSREYNKYNKLGYFDVLFTNEKKEITETTRCNIFIKINNQVYTPPIESGLLAGTFRKLLLDYNYIIQKKIYLQDILKAQKIYITNSVIGIREAKLET
ncbi:MAG: aminodeoxychorismate synthase component I [Endomicrobia bacterium]|nr:aminodeoxychorismate synthase component I [Endomicrobiia bacterium]